MKSLSEIETVSKRSSRAAGFTWGIAEEVGKNTKMLEMFGLPGIKNLNYYFRLRSKKNFEKLNLVSDKNKTEKNEFCPIFAGLSFLDQVRSLESLSEIDTVSKRATRGAGFDWGIAEEVGKNIRMLEMLGMAGIKNLNYYYKIRNKKKI